MKVRLLANTREHPTGRGKVIDLDPDEMSLNPGLFRSLDAEDRVKAAETVRSEVLREHLSQQSERRAQGLVQAEVRRLQGQAAYLRDQATAADLLAQEAERQALAAARALESLPAAAMSSAPALPTLLRQEDPPAPEAAAPHLRRFGGGQVIESPSR